MSAVLRSAITNYTKIFRQMIFFVVPSVSANSFQDPVQVICLYEKWVFSYFLLCSTEKRKKKKNPSLFKCVIDFKKAVEQNGWKVANKEFSWLKIFLDTRICSFKTSLIIADCFLELLCILQTYLQCIWNKFQIKVFPIQGTLFFFFSLSLHRSFRADMQIKKNKKILLHPSSKKKINK